MLKKKKKKIETEKPVEKPKKTVKLTKKESDKQHIEYQKYVDRLVERAKKEMGIVITIKKWEVPGK